MSDRTGSVCLHHSGFEERLDSIDKQLEGIRGSVRGVRNLLIGFLSSTTVTAIAAAAALLHGCQ